MRELAEAEIRAIIRGYVAECLEGDERARVERKRPLSPWESDVQLTTAGFVQSDIKESLACCDYRSFRERVDDLLKDNGLELDPQSYSFKKLCREMAKADVEVLDIVQKREVGDYSDDTPIIPVAASSQPAEQEPSESLSKVIDLYVAEQARGGNWSEKSTTEYTACLVLLKEYLGDIPIKSIDHKAMRGYKEALMKLPANVKKSVVYRNKTVQEILRMNIETPMSTDTLNKYIRRAGSLFKFAVNNGFMDRNPAEGLRVRQTKRDDEFRSVFSPDDLYKLFHSAAYREDNHRHDYYFWMPILGLFTGCRLEELCQLHLDDIRQDEGVWVIDVNNAGEKRVKTKAGVRLIPLHPFLEKDLKLPRYTEKLRAEGHKRLFPELQQRRDGYGQTVSKWFNERYKVKCGIVKDDRKKDFHSFRHTFINALKQARVDTEMLAQVVGHETGSITLERYGKKYGPALLLEEVVKKLHYDVDLSHLKEAKRIAEL